MDKIVFSSSRRIPEPEEGMRKVGQCSFEARDNSSRPRRCAYVLPPPDGPMFSDLPLLSFHRRFSLFPRQRLCFPSHGLRRRRRMLSLPPLLSATIQTLHSWPPWRKSADPPPPPLEANLSPDHPLLLLLSSGGLHLSPPSLLLPMKWQTRRCRSRARQTFSHIPASVAGADAPDPSSLPSPSSLTPTHPQSRRTRSAGPRWCYRGSGACCRFRPLPPLPPLPPDRP